MENFRTRYRAKSFYGLLVLFFVILFNPSLLYSKNPAKIDFSQFILSPSVNQNFSTGLDIKFEVSIPSVQASDIQIISPRENTDYVFKTIKKSELYTEEGGTKIETWFSFEKEGEYTINPLELKVRGVSKEIAFKTVKIKTNPKQLNPIMIIEFSDGTRISTETALQQEILTSVYKGDSIDFTVYFKYGVQLVNFNWEIPKDSIFTQTQEYEIIQKKYVDTNQDIEIPVSSFSWTPLLLGEVKFPIINMSLTSKSGYKTELKFTSLKVQVVPKEQEEEIQEDNIFEQAFIKENIIPIQEARYSLTREECKELARLRKKESNSIFGINRKARVEMEKNYGLPSDINEFSRIYLVFTILLLITSIVCFILCFIKKKNLYKIVTFILIVIFTSLLFFCINKTKVVHGICVGCPLYTIPDLSCESKTELQSGSYVIVQEESGSWLYVLLGENGGWCSVDDIIMIR